MYCLCLVFVLLCLRELVQSQFGKHVEYCRKVCQEWEGSYLAENTICRKRYKKCLEEYFIGFFDDKGNVAFLALKKLFENPVPCKHEKQGTEMKWTLCRSECKIGEKQMEFVSYGVCEPDRYCCELNKKVCGAYYNDIYELPYLKGAGPKCMYNCMLSQTDMLGDNGLIDVESTYYLRTTKKSLLKSVAEECKYHRHLSENRCETAGLFMECTARALINRKEDKLLMAKAIVDTYESL